MSQNLLYMFEFMVDDLLVTRPNRCAPQEYPTCCEISFRSSVFVSICDRVDTGIPKCCKICLFSLESPVTEKDRLLIHAYKKKNESCKYLLGAADMPVKPLFDKVSDTFDKENPYWMEYFARHNAALSDPKAIKRVRATSDNCDEDAEDRREQFFPTSELSKSLLPLFNMKGEQTGHLLLITRLICNGPAIVSSFSFSLFCESGCDGYANKASKTCAKTYSAQIGDSSNRCEKCQMSEASVKSDSNATNNFRYFACDDEYGCSCEECEDDRDQFSTEKSARYRKRPYYPAPRQTGGESCCPKEINDYDMNEQCYCCDDEDADDCEEVSEENSSDSCCMEPCFMESTRLDPGPDAYEEFVACLDGSGITIRVLKDTHKMEMINDGTDGQIDTNDSCCECAGDRLHSSKNKLANCGTLEGILNNSSFGKKALYRRTAGRVVNDPRLPKVRANIKYAGTHTACVEHYNVGFSNMKNACDAITSNLDQYRKSNNAGDCTPLVPSKQLEDTRTCCLQVDPMEIKDMLKGINVDARKKGIEVCYKTCDDPDSDVFVVKLGSKKAYEHKLPSVEIELKTPKMPISCTVQNCTIETQIQENELDAALAGLCKKGKGKGKKVKKGKK